MVSFDIVKGNPGALTFLIEAYEKNPFKAERAFRRMDDNNIKGDKLYMIWNDCCGKDTDMAISVMLEKILRRL